MWTNSKICPRDDKKPSGAAIVTPARQTGPSGPPRRRRQGQTVYRLHTLLSDWASHCYEDEDVVNTSLRSMFLAVLHTRATALPYEVTLSDTVPRNMCIYQCLTRNCMVRYVKKL